MSQKERERERERKRGLICEVVESGSFQMDFKRKARRADELTRAKETRCFFLFLVIISIISFSSSFVFDRRFTKTCEGANMANHLCYRYTLVLLDFYVLHGV